MFKKKLNQVKFVIFDVETTGLDPFSGDRIVEIAAKKFLGLNETGNFSSLINPGRPISQAAYMVNHISSEMLRGAPKAEAVLKKFTDFIKGSCLMGYNVNFDLAFLNNELSVMKKSLPQHLPIVDILRISRVLLPKLGSFSLLNVSQFLGINNEQSHRAAADVELTFKVFRRFFEILEDKGLDDLVNFLHMFGVNTKLHALLSNIKLAQIQEAIDSSLKLRIKYFSSSAKQVTERQITPKEIRKENNKDFLVGFCHLRNEERSFRIDRILELTLL
jgi:DNA polymerase III epsilon subunit family exonuclease